jgi:hypothetical protein
MALMSSSSYMMSSLIAFLVACCSSGLSQSVKGEERREGKRKKREEKQRTLKIVGERNANLVSGTEVVLSEGRDLAAVGDGDRTSLAVGLVVAGLLVVLELRGKRGK